MEQNQGSTWGMAKSQHFPVQNILAWTWLDLGADELSLTIRDFDFTCIPVFDQAFCRKVHTSKHSFCSTDGFSCPTHPFYWIWECAELFFRATSCNLRRILAFWYQSYYWYCSGPFNGDHNDQYTLPLLSIATLLNPGEFLAKQALSLLFISFTICMIKYMLTLLYPRQILKVMLEKMLDKS